MRFSIATAWSSAEWGGVIGRRPLSLPGQPNDLWCADYKGEFMLADRRYCYPLTITDFASRYLFACEALSTTKEAYAFPVFKAGRSGWFAKRLAQSPSEGQRRGAESRHHPEPVRSEMGVERARGKRQQRRWGTDADGAIER